VRKKGFQLARVLRMVLLNAGYSVHLYSDKACCFNQSEHGLYRSYVAMCSCEAQLIKETGYEGQQSPLFDVLVMLFSLDFAQVSIDFEFCMSNYPVEMLL